MTYNIDRIAYELEQTALGKAYYGNALYVARDLPCITGNDLDCLNKWLFGNDIKLADTIRLQEIAMEIKEWGEQHCIYPI